MPKYPHLFIASGAYHQYAQQRGATMAPDAVLDAGEAGCGELTLLIFQAVRRLAPGQTLEVYAYDLAAAMDIPAWCRSTGNLLVQSDTGAHPQRFVIRKRSALGAQTNAKAAD
jgi:TusA-related sulfurtransferase